jgi:NAD(P)H dehydrogenase (quinone)
MTIIAIACSSNDGHTRHVAEHVAAGAAAVPGAHAELLEITAAAIGADGRWRDPDVMAQLSLADAIIFGAPTLMGSAHGVFKLFLEDAFNPAWLGQVWKDKIAAGFTNSAARSGDKLVALQQFAVFAAQMGMIWVGVGDPPGGNRTDSTPDDVNHLGSWLGLMTQSPGTVEAHPGLGFASAGDLLTAERFGRRVARTTLRWGMGAEAYPTQRFQRGDARRRDQAGLDEWRQHDD